MQFDSRSGSCAICTGPSSIIVMPQLYILSNHSHVLAEVLIEYCSHKGHDGFFTAEKSGKLR